MPQVLACLGGLLGRIAQKRLVVKRRRLVEAHDQPLTTALRLRVTSHLVDLDPCALGKHANGIGEIQVLGAHQIAKGVPALAASEAVPQLCRTVHFERGRLLVVERTQPPVEASLLLENDRLGDQGDDVGRVPHARYIFIRYASHVASSPPLLTYSQLGLSDAVAYVRQASRPEYDAPEAASPPREHVVIHSTRPHLAAGRVPLSRG